MQFPDCTNLLTQDNSFALGSGSIFVQQNQTQGAPFPPAPGDFLLLDGTDFLLLDNTNLLLL
jgi:hypothetical protein